MPDNIPADERTAYLLEAYAARGDAIKRDQEQADLMRTWVDEVRKLYGEELNQPLTDVEPDPDAP